MFSAAGGGFTYLAPTDSPNNTAGWVTSGIQSSAIQRITFATDTASASTRGAQAIYVYYSTGLSTASYGWVTGGANPGTTGFSNTQRITYATDTSTTSTRGPLAQAPYRAAAAGTTTSGWVVGGFEGSFNTTGSSRVSRVDYATDTATGVFSGPANRILAKHGGVGNSSYGWFGGGYYPSGFGSYWTGVQRMDYSNDSAAFVNRGPLASNKYMVANTGNSSYGWWYCGRPSGGPGNSLVERIDYSNDTATTSIRGPLTAIRYGGMGSGSNNYGYVAGNQPGTVAPTTSVDRVDYANDTATATAVGPLTLKAGVGAGLSGVQ